MQTYYKDLKINYRTNGAGPCLVFLHGYLESLEVWDSVVPKLSESYQVVCIDLPGHGESDYFPRISRMDDMADTIKAVLDDLNISNAVMFGHSMGGYATLAFLEKYPEYLKAFSLVHSHALADSEEVKLKRNREICIIEKGEKHLLVNLNLPKLFADQNLERFRPELEELKERAWSFSDKGVTSAIAGLRERPNREEILKKAKIPCLYIAGKYDNYISLDDVSRRMELPTQSQFVILKQSGHLGFIEEPEAFLEATHQFLSGL